MNGEENQEIEGIAGEVRKEKKKGGGFVKIFNHPLLSFAFFALFNVILANLVTFGLTVVLNLLGKSMQVCLNISYAAAAISSLLMLLAFSLIFRKRFAGFFTRLDLSDKELYLAVLISLAAICLVIALSFIETGVNFSFSSLFISIYAGAFEETSFRAFGTGVMMKAVKDEKKLWLPLFVPSAVFGLFHFTNMVAGQAFSVTVMQVFFAFSIGTFFAAVYLRTGNILLTMLYHLIYDFVSLLQTGYQNGIVTAEEMALSDWIFNISLSVVYLGLAVFLMRKAKRQGVLSVWKGIWIDDMSNKEDSVIEVKEEIPS